MDMNFPKHIGLIMDGNGRWAKKKLLSKNLGHKAGAEALNNLIQEIEKTPIKHITVYAFSTENWKRSKEEVDSLMKLLKEYINEYIKKNEKSNIKIDVIGDIDELEQDLQKDIKHLKEISKNKTGLNLNIALNYGGRNEITRAVKKIASQVKEGKININQITEQTIAKNLDTYKIPDPELIIRTSGELRLSNFLTWQSAYSELYFSPKLWPDFKFNDFQEALKHFNQRERRFGGRNEE